MRIILFNGKNLSKLTLPSKVDGSFWLEDDIENNNVTSNVVVPSQPQMFNENQIQSTNMQYPQQGGANAVSINIYNPQAYGGTSMPAQAQGVPYNYTNSLYQMPQGSVYACRICSRRTAL